jgi:heme/copper-type cytochrome/quinol oxidase subunit 2
MNLAIVVLLIPPVSIFCTIFAVAYRKRKGDDEDAE